MGAVYYDVMDETGRYEIEVRRSVCDYQRSIYNGGPAEFERDVVGAINLARRSTFCDKAIPESTLHAINRILQAEHVASIRQIEADPFRYGVLEADDKLRRAPPILSAAVYKPTGGWLITTVGVDESKMAHLGVPKHVGPVMATASRMEAA
jgi:hypothetical protein